MPAPLVLGAGLLSAAWSQALVQSAPAAVVINEIMYHPASQNGAEEYVELLNTGPGPVALQGWQFTKGISFTFPAATLPPQGYLVVAADPAVFTAKYPGVTNVVGGWLGGLNNSDETILLNDASGTEISRVHYADQGDWAVRRRGPLDYGSRGWEWFAAHDGLGKSLELINPQLSEQIGQNWASSLVNEGTPGGPNSVAQTDSAPLIAEVHHLPPVPASTDAVAVTARILDESATGLAVTLAYRDHSSTSPPPFLNLTMVDDGLHQDGLAGDGVFGAVLPAQPAGTVIEFYVEARDAAAHTRTWPAPALDENGLPVQAANALYQVDDSVYSGGQPVLRLVMTESERSELEKINRSSNAEMNAALISDDGGSEEVRYAAGIRIRGASTRFLPVPNYRVEVPSDRRWEGVTAVNLNTYYAHAQLVGSVLTHLAGLPAANARAVQVRINGLNLAKPGAPSVNEGSGFGSYVQLEVVDSDWAGLHFPNDPKGNAYFARRPNTDLSYLGTNWQSYAGRGYSKESNRSENDWSDLIHLTDVLNNTPDATYAEEVGKVLDPLEWVRYFALNIALGNNESGLSTGEGDDYDMYRGATDPRFLLVPHDWDTILDFNAALPVDSDIWRATALPAVNRFLKHPEFAPLYFGELKRMIDQVCVASKFDPLVDRYLGSYVAPNTIAAMKNYARARADYIRSQIPDRLTVTNSAPIQNEYPTVTSPQILLSGEADAVRTRSVVVGGVPAQWTAWQARWTNEVTLLPGINRVLVQALDEHGQVFDETFIDVYYDSGSVTTVPGGDLPQDTVWSAANGPYYLNGALTVPAGRTLTIQPGTSVFFGPDTYLTVYGRLLAEGTPTNRLRFSLRPGVGISWNGIRIYNSTEDNRLTYAVMESVGPASPLDIRNSVALLEGIYFRGRATCLYFTNSSLYVKKCYFPKMYLRETVVGYDILEGGHLIFEENYFGGTSGYNDLIEYTGGKRPGPIVQVLNNVFEYGTDDAVDFDETDAHIEGNVMRHFHRDAPRESQSEGVATDAGSEVVVVRNVMYDCDVGVLLKRGAYLAGQNNVFIHEVESGVEFGSTNHAILPGRGAYLDGNIFWEDTVPLQRIQVYEYPPADVVVNHCIIQGTNWPGNGNFSADPLFVDPTNDFHLQPGSPAIGAGPNGLDIGAYVPPGVSLSGEPPAVTSRTSAVLTVAGPGYLNPGISNLTNYYRFRVNDGPWSADQLIDQPIVLSNLTDGIYTVYAVGRNSAGVWQDTNQATISRTWRVNTGLFGLRINEVLAQNASVSNHFGAWPDLIELYNAGATAVDLAGLSLTDDATLPSRFVFPFGTTLEPDAYLVLLADAPDGTPGIHLGFSLGRKGEGVYLFDSPANGGALLDAVTFGLQVTDLSIGRLDDGSWGLTRPSFGSRNLPLSTGDPGKLRLTEWLARSSTDDFVEVYNPLPFPVALGGLYFTDNVLGWPTRHRLPPLSYIAPQSYLAFQADGNPQNGADHLNFSLASEQGEIALLDSDLALIDFITYGPQRPGVSEGRLAPDSEVIGFFTQPSPGADNVLNVPPTVALTHPLPNQVIQLPADILLSADASDADGQIVKVEFYQGTVKLGEDAEFPYSLTWSNVSPGSYTFFARAFDDRGAFANSSTVTVNPYPPAVSLLTPTNGQLGLLGVGVNLNATVTNAATSIERVEFFADDLKVGEDLLSPYQFTWTPNDAHVFRLRAEAVLNGGSRLVSEEVNLRVLNARVTPATLVPTNSIWKYLDTGVDLGTNWWGLYFDDAAWGQGPAVLGYGIPNLASTVGYGPDSGNKYITTYFRLKFEAGTVGGWTNVVLSLMRDDGAVVYLNGEEIVRSNLPEGPVEYGTTALESTPYGITYLPFPVEGWRINPGANQLAVEVHQVTPFSGDISFALGLDGEGWEIEPWIVNQPADATAPVGTDLKLAVAAVGQPLAYQWYRTGGKTVPDATTSELSLNGIQPEEAGGYYVVITNELGSATSQLALVQVETVDSDGDGIPDYWELRYGLDPQDPADAAQDWDGDGLTNADEFFRHLNPLQMDLALIVSPLPSSGSLTGLLFRFVAVSNSVSTLEYKNEFCEPTWQPLHSDPAQPSNHPVQIITAPGGQKRFYRIRTE
jgi:CotH kinase protein/Lamin Tail Domain/Bacterial Ig domain/Bacterial TSP3 repeat